MMRAKRFFLHSFLYTHHFVRVILRSQDPFGGTPISPKSIVLEVVLNLKSSQPFNLTELAFDCDQLDCFVEIADKIVSGVLEGSSNYIIYICRRRAR